MPPDTQPDPSVANAAAAGLRGGPVANPSGRRERVGAFLASYWTPAGKQALRNLSGLVLCTSVSQACALGVLLILTNGLSQTAFGAVIFALNLQAYLITLGTFGLTSIVVRDLTQQPEKADETITAFFLIIGVSSLITGAFTAAAAAVVPISWDERVMLWCLAAGNVFACLNLTALYDAAHRQALAAVLMLPADLMGLGAVAVLSATGTLTVSLIGLVLLGKMGLTATLHAVTFSRVVRPFRRRLTRARAVRMVRSGWSLLVASLIAGIPLNGSIILIRFLSGEELTAIYGVALQVVNIEILILSLLMRIILPHMTGPHGLTSRFLLQLFLAVGSTVAALVTVVLGVGWFLFHRVLRPEYQPAYEVLAVLQTAIGCCAATSAVHSYLLRFHRERWIQAAYFIAGSLYFALVFLGMHQYRLGFALATVIYFVLILTIGSLGLLRKPGPECAQELDLQSVPNGPRHSSEA